MGDVLLRERISVLVRTLDAVERVIDDLEASQGGGITVPSAATDALVSMREQFEVLRASTKGIPFPPGTGPKVGAALGALQGWLDELGSGLQAPQQSPRLKVRLNGLVASLNESVTRRKKTLEALIEEVDRPEGLGEEERAAAWRRYRMARADCHRLFADYLDLLRGVALRESGLDDGLCQIADALVREFGPFGGVSWDSLTVPASRERRDGPATFIVRIGFPEWSVWTLPLAAIEFASFLINEHRRFIELHEKVTDQLTEPVLKAGEGVEQHGLSSLIDAEELADEEEARAEQLHVALSPLTDLLMVEVLATTLMGPAYAWSALLMRVDPEPGHDVVEVLRRDAVVTTLTKLEEDLRDPARLQARRELLTAEWDALLGTAGIEVSDQTAQEPSDPVDRALREALGMVVEEILAIVSFRFGDPEWDLIEALADKMRSMRAAGEILDSITDSHGRPSLRQVLNAGWVLRLPAREGAPGAPTEPVDLPSLSRVVHDVCVGLRRKEDTEEETSTAGRSPQTIPSPGGEVSS